MTYVAVEKSPTEDLPFEWNFGVGDFDALLDSDPIDEPACTVRDWSDVALSNAAGFVVVGSPAKSLTEPKVLQVRISGGTHGVDYQIKLKAVTTTNDYDAECFILCRVRRPTVP
jgi:hypothetical protein